MNRWHYSKALAFGLVSHCYKIVQKKFRICCSAAKKIFYLFAVPKICKMKKLSRWANRHIIASRILIGILQIMIGIVAIFLANQLSNLNIHFPIWWIYVAAILFFILIRFYPFSISNPRTHFVKQKLFDF